MASLLKSPGKVIAWGDRLIISDSGHHRILITNAYGELQQVIGGRGTGFSDGDFENATFSDPQGLCIFQDEVYVSDTRNHTIRKINFSNKKVITVAGTGHSGTNITDFRKPARQIPLQSPFDLCTVGDEIFVAMTGSHQLWKFNPGTGGIEPYAGNGKEVVVDGSLFTSSFVKPSILKYDSGKILIADHSTNLVRALDLKNEVVSTVIGPESIKPGRLAILGEKNWIVADTNNHRVIRMQDGSITEIEIRDEQGLLSKTISDSPESTDPNAWFTNFLNLTEQDGFSSGQKQIILRLINGEAWSFAEGTTLQISFEVTSRPDLIKLRANTLMLKFSQALETVDVTVQTEILPFSETIVEVELVAHLKYIVCNRNLLKIPGILNLRIPMRLIKTSAKDSINFEVHLPEY